MASGSALLEIGGSSADLDEVEAFVRALVGDEERARRRPLMTAAPVLRLFGRQEATPEERATFLSDDAQRARSGSGQFRCPLEEGDVVWAPHAGTGVQELVS